MDALLEQRRQLSRGIGELGRRVRVAKAAAKQAARTAARQWALTDTLLRTVLIAYVLADGMPDPAVVFLRGKAAQFGWPAKTDEETASLVDEVFLEILHENGFDGVVIPDHTPQMNCAAPWHAGMAFAMGYLRAMISQVGD